jgi:hypothetical protein
MRLSSEDFATHDTCARLETYSSRYEPLRLSINYALNQAIHAALSESSPIAASDKIMELAARPGLDVEGKVYEAAIHHSRLSELIATYLLSIEKFTVPESVTMPWGEFQPQSFLVPGNRLCRVVLCDRWTTEREQMERFSWRTAVDTAITGMPMVMIAVVIGGIRDGRRASAWTQGYLHPSNQQMRVLKRDGEQFGDNWRRVWREESDIKPLEWLKVMQQDGAFDSRVFSITQDVPRNRDEVLAQIEEMAREMGSMRQTRSNCYRFKPCPFLKACLSAKSPAELGWVEKDSLLNQGHGKVALTI